MRAAGEDPIGAGEYGFTLMLSAVWVWPLYVAALYGFVVDRESVDPGAKANVGVVARDGIARFDDFALWLAS